MQTEKHTPAPWTATDDHRGVWEIIHQGDMLAQVWRVKPGVDGDLPAEANARLMAAAPDLLAALKLWVGYFDRLSEQSDPDDRLAIARNNYHHSRVEVSRAAIAKAEGSAA